MEKRSDLLKERIEAIKKDCQGAELIAVSKFHPLEELLFAYEAGQRHFGENRVQELKEKAEAFHAKGLDDVIWHFIGHLQTNKLNMLLKVPNLTYIHSIDSLRLLEELYKKEEMIKGREISFLLEINTSNEEEKEGIDSREELLSILDLIKSKKDSPFKLVGLMTMGKIRTDDLLGDARICFRSLKEKRDLVSHYVTSYGLKLSMGMSQDWPVAVEEGADFIRVGTAIFGERSY